MVTQERTHIRIRLETRFKKMNVEQLIKHLKSASQKQTMDVNYISDEGPDRYWIKELDTDNGLFLIAEYEEPEENQEMTTGELLQKLQDLKLVDLSSKVTIMLPSGEELCILAFKGNPYGLWSRAVMIYADDPISMNNY